MHWDWNGNWCIRIWQTNASYFESSCDPLWSQYYLVLSDSPVSATIWHYRTNIVNLTGRLQKKNRTKLPYNPKAYKFNHMTKQINTCFLIIKILKLLLEVNNCAYKKKKNYFSFWNELQYIVLSQSSQLTKIMPGLKLEKIVR